MRAGADSDTAQRVHDSVMATQHDAPAALGSSADAQLLVDIELSILGSPVERFERYDQDLHKEYAREYVREYARAPRFRYHRARAQVLQGFLDRPRLYHSGAARALLESQARLNLSAALLRLAQ